MSSPKYHVIRVQITANLFAKLWPVEDSVRSERLNPFESNRLPRTLWPEAIQVMIDLIDQIDLLSRLPFPVGLL